ncbi:DNA excision repair protein ERCC-8-like [Hetaerina americana]|uniref:DNA excision repair protein ERCC-8-like n=1 Tax=Hetaerina americana TaxID=62018 RepID=UPI003A7F21D5
MLSLIENVRAGISPAYEIKRAVVIKRAFTLQVVKDWELEDVHSGGVNCLDIDPSEHRYLLSGSNDGCIYIHDLLNYYGQCNYIAKVLCRIKRTNPGSHQFSVESVQWYPFDSGSFVSSGMDRKVKLWDSNLLTVAYETTLPGKIYHHEMSKVPSQNYLVAAATSTKNLILLDLKSGSKSHELVGHSAGILTCNWSPRDDSLLATGSCDNQIFLWDIRSSKACLMSLDQHNGKGSAGNLSSCTAHDGYVNGLRFTENGFFLVSFGNDCKLRVWDVIKGTNIMVNFGTTHSHLKRSVQLDVTACHVEHDLLFVPSTNHVLVYEIMSGIQVKKLIGHFDSVNCCTYEPWHQQLFSGGKDRTILCWSSEIHKMKDPSCRKDNLESFSNQLFSDNWND